MPPKFSWCATLKECSKSDEKTAAVSFREDWFATSTASSSSFTHMIGNTGPKISSSIATSAFFGT